VVRKGSYLESLFYAGFRPLFQQSAAGQPGITVRTIIVESPEITQVTHLENERVFVGPVGSDRMLSTFRQQFSSCLLAQLLQHVQLLIESLGSTANSGFSDLDQPLCSMTGIVNVPSGAGNRSAAIQRFQPIHDPRQIFDHRQITPGQFPQHPYPRLAMIDRLELVDA
jgi:hypothetical protein